MSNAIAHTFIVSAENNATGRYMYFEVRGCANHHEALERVYSLGGFSCGDIEVRSEWPDRKWREILSSAEILE
jgi:hypothetical protein